MSSSPAISLVKPLGRPLRACPYCDHVSPADAKFCGACGAALHLLPCPNCGAVNDITKVKACYRCHHELEESTVQAAALPAPGSPIDATPAAAGHADGPAARQRPHMAAVMIILIAFAAASYYAYRQRSTLANRESAPAGNEAKGSVNTAPAPAQATTPAANVPVTATKSAAPVTPPAIAETKKEIVAAPPVAAAIAPPAAAIAPATTTRPRRQPREAPSTAVAPPDLPPRTPAAGIQTEAPRIGPCTDAVAALGLCTRDAPANPTNPPAQKRQ